jgi:hypothetical protein
MSYMWSQALLLFAWLHIFLMGFYENGNAGAMLKNRI